MLCLFHHGRQEAGQCLVIESEEMRARESRGDRETETKRRGEKETWGGGGGRKRGEAERDREGVKASRDTSRCQTHRHTAATDSSSQPRLQAQLDTGNE